jgi:hypothetical protein
MLADAARFAQLVAPYRHISPRRRSGNPISVQQTQATRPLTPPDVPRCAQLIAPYQHILPGSYAGNRPSPEGRNAPG